MLTQSISSQGYTAEELQYAMQKLSVDPELDKKLSFPNGRITGADFERHIAGLRKLKRVCDPAAKLSRFEVSKIIEQFPGEVGWDNFGVCGYDKEDVPLYRYSSQPLQSISPAPQIPEQAPVQRTSGGMIKLGDLI